MYLFTHLMLNLQKKSATSVCALPSFCDLPSSMFLPPHSSHKEGVWKRLCDPIQRMTCIFVVEPKSFHHSTANHQQNYVNPTTGAHTETIEWLWLDPRISILKRKRGVLLYQYQIHLDHYCWQMKRKTKLDLFLAFLDDVRRTSIGWQTIFWIRTKPKQ